MLTGRSKFKCTGQVQVILNLILRTSNKIFRIGIYVSFTVPVLKLQIIVALNLVDTVCTAVAPE
eukprot:SAG31_NODE_21369_length_551_cov_1.203540_1_plen_64_part_00